MFKINKKLKGFLGRVGEIKTSHGIIKTPAFSVVGTKATVKSLSPEQVKDLGTEVVLANTYHLYLEPGEKIIKSAGGLNKFMNWNGPTITDSGGFQVFSLGSGFDSKVNKIGREETEENITNSKPFKKNQTKITEDGVEFKSHIDGSSHFFTPEKSIEIQHDIGADIIFAFDECTSPNDSEKYLEEAMNRTHRWAERCLKKHEALRQNSGQIETNQFLFGIVQGGNNEKLRKESAKIIGAMNFDGFGIGGSFEKKDIEKSLVWINSILSEEKPRHLLGIGEPEDLFIGVENGIDTFDCVSPTRIARNGSLYTENGRINILNADYKNDFSKIDEKCECYTCRNYTKAYLSHLHRSKEILGSTLASVHNLYFIVNLIKKMRQSILDDTFFEFKKDFLRKYY